MHCFLLPDTRLLALHAGRSQRLANWHHDILPSDHQVQCAWHRACRIASLTLRFRLFRFCDLPCATDTRRHCAFDLYRKAPHHHMRFAAMHARCRRDCQHLSAGGCCSNLIAKDVRDAPARCGSAR
ncbi:hypothetical protein EBA01_14955 [Xanthomonas oryzae pv. oryzae]|nr:hypothetical protein BVV20_15430 [Xanthomonas oryzae pv. oryzae]AVT99801.1 hypothetical protein C0L89_14945 [Xanthomonas oryzae pv. oryzae]QBN29093.1 hypothetical protein EBA01_14955 [Xanthomonas oryzae pv. oryzae]QBN31829.1 hypothetical protein EBA02_08850 [Xanthomonas oryzae pv. oryzae]QBN61834.1 hypothetical protein EBA10_14975 [Xanthomonas oryzae pv. oryzae]